MEGRCRKLSSGRLVLLLNTEPLDFKASEVQNLPSLCVATKAPDMLLGVRNGTAVFDILPPPRHPPRCPIVRLCYLWVVCASEEDDWAKPRNAQSDFRVDYKGMEWMDYTTFGEQLLC